MRFLLGEGMLLIMALMGIAAAAYTMAYQAWGVMNSVSTEDIMSGAAFILMVLWIAYARWLYGVLRKPTKTQQRLEYYTKVDKPPYDMAKLERDTHDWRLSGKPGSLAAGVIGIEAIDEYLDNS